MGLLMLTLEDTLGDIKGRVTRRYICEYDFQKASASPLKISALHSTNASIEI